MTIPLAVEPLTSRIGATVQGLSLADGVDPEVASALRAALDEHLVLFFRDQHLTVADQLRVAAAFGPLNAAGFAAPDAQGDERSLDRVEDGPEKPPGADFWHTDLPFWSAPPNVAVLCAELVPPFGGDTLWLSLYELYDALSPTMRELLVGLRVRIAPSSVAVVDVAGRRRVERTAADDPVAPTVVHPLVQVHPGTGRPYLYITGATTQGIDGLSRRESDALLAMLREGLSDPALSCRWRWQAGDVVVWDERCTNHRATSDHYPAERRMRRCTAGTTVPTALV